MKRKLINYDVFQKINEESLTKAETELADAAEVLAKALGEEQLTLHCFNESSVTYETLDGSFINASYHLEGKHVIFENIEQLVIDESSSINKSREVLRKVFDEVLKDNVAGADAAFKEYVELPYVRRKWLEGTQVWVEPKAKAHKRRGPQPSWVVRKRTEARKRSQALVSTSQKQRAKMERESLKKRFGPGTHIHYRFKPQAKRKMYEWYNISENVFNYVDFQEFGPIARESDVKKDTNGNVVAIRIPNTASRNEGKILTFNWKTLNADSVILRAKMKNLAEDVNFCKAMADLRKCNAESDNKKLEQILEAIIVRWPNVIYLTQYELAEAIAKALDTIGESNYEDQTCSFMAEAILRTAVDAYEDRVNRIVALAGAKLENVEDKYVAFQNIVEKFYTFIDDNTKLEMQVFVDLYNTLVEVYKVAHEEGNEFLMGETNTFLRELKEVIDQNEEPTLDLAADVAAWLANLVETNLETADWKVSNTPYITVNGDHPQMAKNAQKPYQPNTDFSGNWGDSLPVSQGTPDYKTNKLADEMRGDAWANWGNDDTWPALRNPYSKGSDATWTMKGEKGADTTAYDDDWSRYQSKDTWPALQNPYVPKAETPDSYKMNHGKEDDLLIDK
jgi:hypothetical protein